ncbi:hypothetical protein [Hafnia alvei]|uniref:hypothetical protein n=1 Tax=Hafnia alvei TaxID=569 RepID=UPI000620F4D6|nr:hypothetical protein [Hafnia alvei]KKI42924.1 hypothetical protein XK86_15700 [Hafnia alvei]
MSEIQSETESKEMVFLSFYPKGVPPKESKNAEGEFFRIVKEKPPAGGCFKSMFEEKPKRLKKFHGFDLKCCYGISVYSNEAAVVNAFDKFPEGAGQFYVAQGTVCPEDGRMMKTFSDPAHHTLWLREGHDIHKKFSCTRGLNK